MPSKSVFLYYNHGWSASPSPRFSDIPPSLSYDCTSNRVFYQMIILISCWHTKDKNSQILSTLNVDFGSLKFDCFLLIRQVSRVIVSVFIYFWSSFFELYKVSLACMMIFNEFFRTRYKNEQILFLSVSLVIFFLLNFFWWKAKN